MSTLRFFVYFDTDSNPVFEVEGERDSLNALFKDDGDPDSGRVGRGGNLFQTGLGKPISMQAHTTSDAAAGGDATRHAVKGSIADASRCPFILRAPTTLQNTPAPTQPDTPAVMSDSATKSSPVTRYQLFPADWRIEAERLRRVQLRSAIAIEREELKKQSIVLKDEWREKLIGEIEGGRREAIRTLKELDGWAIPEIKHRYLPHPHSTRIDERVYDDMMAAVSLSSLSRISNCSREPVVTVQGIQANGPAYPMSNMGGEIRSSGHASWYSPPASGEGRRKKRKNGRRVEKAARLTSPRSILANPPVPGLPTVPMYPTVANPNPSTPLNPQASIFASNPVPQPYYPSPGLTPPQPVLSPRCGVHAIASSPASPLSQTPLHHGAFGYHPLLYSGYGYRGIPHSSVTFPATYDYPSRPPISPPNPYAYNPYLPVGPHFGQTPFPSDSIPTTPVHPQTSLPAKRPVFSRTGKGKSGRRILNQEFGQEDVDHAIQAMLPGDVLAFLKSRGWLPAESSIENLGWMVGTGGKKRMAVGDVHTFVCTSTSKDKGSQPALMAATGLEQTERHARVERIRRCRPQHQSSTRPVVLPVEIPVENYILFGDFSALSLRRARVGKDVGLVGGEAEKFSIEG